MESTHIRISKEFKKILQKKRKHGESMERTILNVRNMHPIDAKLKSIFDDQAKRRKEFSKKQQKRREKK